MQLTEYEQKALQKLGQSIQSGQWSNDGLVELIKLSGEFLNLKTIPDYCTDTGMSYQGAMKPTSKRKIEILFNVKFVIDND